MTEDLLTRQSLSMITDPIVSNITMNEPRYRRRKEDRPEEITAAALAEFAEKGYAATRMDDVARRAGVSKGLTYLYFKTKEELFKAVINSVVVPRVDAMTEFLAASDQSPTEIIRGPMLDFMKRLPGSKIAIVIRLLLSEGHRYPDLMDFYWKNVVSRGLSAFTALVERGIERGEFRQSAVTDLPQLFVAPVIFSVVWKNLFAKHPLDTDDLISTQVEMLLKAIEA